MKIEKVLNLLHMARKAGHLIVGFDACKRSLMAGDAKLLILAEDLASRQKSEMINVSEACNVKWIEIGTKEKFGEAFKTRDLGIISVEDHNFAKGILKKTDIPEDKMGKKI
ncbi:MAG: ribosomal L7Ae/L30e/S12e/Gadd45 family protein [Candidatus Cloacimonetes bacterium]|nr:ribosomal L7Ae/L30e/S12e/Gadd45 family protein [Candidatus Cloacimonadota bacterium]MCF7813496.1 ribosomal L7Ae/L30e/S12e/Gadd45 family protein [Candidatus Cloacimonadota bacterium]MCF7868581.1 ribosomal L7Ae/L30e/S12e/Gadd45 family protein [Candidatus Cloacimonadota bacterium]MCF7883368.1 ribosomal L7Ae/L30e/S12e/Gadd45 family protein [Candidatus Cloacimonadota bacterium]